MCRHSIVDRAFHRPSQIRVAGALVVFKVNDLAGLCGIYRAGACLASIVSGDLPISIQRRPQHYRAGEAVYRVTLIDRH